MTAVVVLAALAVAIWVVMPLRRGPAPLADGDSRLEEVAAKKTIALVALDDLDAERLSGKLSNRDYERLRREYEAEALAALHELDSLSRSDDALEAEIADARRRLAEQ
jgi:hypothetical protein